MMKLPAREDGRWTVQYANDKLPDIVATRNLTFDKEGYLRLSKPVLALYTSSDSANHDLPVKYTRKATNQIFVFTQKNCFELDLRRGMIRLTQDTSANAPTGSVAIAPFTHADWFNNTIAYSTLNGISTWDPSTGFAGTWTDRGLSLSSVNRPVKRFVSRNTLATTNEQNTMVQYNTSFTSGGSTLTIPADYRITSMSFNNGYMGIGAYDNRFNGNGAFFVWDGATVNTNYSYPINANSPFLVIPYKGSFVITTSVGQLLYWTPSGLIELANFPSYFSSGVDAIEYGYQNSHGSGYLVEGDVFHLNTDGGLVEPDENGRLFLTGQSMGVWSYDPSVGLYHRHATTATKAQHEQLNAGSVDTTENTITVSSAPETGTPVYYHDGGVTSIGGLVDGQLYYTIYVDATTIQIAETYEDAIAETAIPLTSNVSVDTILTSAVSTGNDTITTSGVVSPGTAFVYDNGGGTSITGLTHGTTYYASGGTATISVHATWANAMALASKIDLTGTGNDAQTIDFKRHTLTFISKRDFGQSYSTSMQGAIDVHERVSVAGTNPMFAGYLLGAKAGASSTTELFATCATLRETENRGYFITGKILSQQMQDTWQKLYIKHSELTKTFDKIVVKYRIKDTELVKIRYEDGVTVGSIITWTASNTFTTTDTQYADVLVGDEVEVVQGAGSGYLLHISSITETGGTYTVVLDESVKNIVATNTGRAVVSRWTLAKVLDGTTPQNEDGYSEISIGKNSKSIQFKIELRGEDVEIEELLIAHEPFKKVV